jgi:hypothetical protein
MIFVPWDMLLGCKRKNNDIFPLIMEWQPRKVEKNAYFLNRL